jgi:hypothetical protein
VEKKKDEITELDIKVVQKSWSWNCATRFSIFFTKQLAPDTWGQACLNMDSNSPRDLAMKSPIHVVLYFNKNSIISPFVRRNLYYSKKYRWFGLRQYYELTNFISIQ